MTLTGLCKRLSRLTERLGFHLVAHHYYEPIPDVRHIHNHLKTPHFLDGIDYRLDEACELLRTFEQYKNEYAALPPTSAGMYGYADSMCLYSMIRHFKPKRVVEVGSGESSGVLAAAISAGDLPVEHTCIEPYPRGPLPGRHIQKPVQDVELDVFSALDRGDVLFIDSTHVAKVGSDVLDQFFRIIPALRPGVLIHFHDIFLPFEYNERYLCEKRYYWNEQYVLGAFLLNNNQSRVLLPTQYLHRNRPDAMKRTFPKYDPAAHNPTSFWIEL